MNGFRAFIGYAPRSQTGVAVVSNTTIGAVGIEGIGFHLLDPGRGLASLRVETLVDGTILDTLVGQCIFDNGKALKIFREGDSLSVLTLEGKRGANLCRGIPQVVSQGGRRTDNL